MESYQIILTGRDPQSLHKKNMGATYGTRPKKMVRTLYSLSPSEFKR